MGQAAKRGGSGGKGGHGETTLETVTEELRMAQPTGNTLSTTQVSTQVPFLLKLPLREYQHIGLHWLATLHDKNLNGILADEMGLGKTIQTIALLAHLACEQGIWGPHLIVVPTSVMLNWEMELKKWCPGFKVLTYYGSKGERQAKRQGWSKPYSFHVCISSYTLVLQDAVVFRRKQWYYMILDEAQNIKNFKSQRWQTLLTFNTSRRLLLTGTPLQNDLLELWSLMHFLMPTVFESHADFKEWFSDPLTAAIEKQQVSGEQGLIKRLHAVLRPFLLRRLKKDVEQQMPSKFEHVIRCSLQKRQRALYEEFMASRQAQSCLTGADFIGMMNVLMQLRKVCNHPELFEPRGVESPFIPDSPLVCRVPSFMHLWRDEPHNMTSMQRINEKSALPVWSLLTTECTSEKTQILRAQELRYPLPLTAEWTPDDATFEHALAGLQVSVDHPGASPRRKSALDVSANLQGSFLNRLRGKRKTIDGGAGGRGQQQALMQPVATRMLKNDAKNQVEPEQPSASQPPPAAAADSGLGLGDSDEDDGPEEDFVGGIEWFQCIKCDKWRCLGDSRRFTRKERKLITFCANDAELMRCDHCHQVTCDMPEDDETKSRQVNWTLLKQDDRAFREKKRAEEKSARQSLLPQPPQPPEAAPPAHAPPDHPSAANGLFNPPVALGQSRPAPMAPPPPPFPKREEDVGMSMMAVDERPLPVVKEEPTNDNHGVGVGVANGVEMEVDVSPAVDSCHGDGGSPFGFAPEEGRRLGSASVPPLDEFVLGKMRAQLVREHWRLNSHYARHPFIEQALKDVEHREVAFRQGRWRMNNALNTQRLDKAHVVYGTDCIKMVKSILKQRRRRRPDGHDDDGDGDGDGDSDSDRVHRAPHTAALLVHERAKSSQDLLDMTAALKEMCPTPLQVLHRLWPMLRHALCAVPKVTTTAPILHLTGPGGCDNVQRSEMFLRPVSTRLLRSRDTLLHPIQLNLLCSFPDRRMLQWDCGKLTVLDGLLKRLKQEGHRCLLFTQMSKMLDVLEDFINLHGHTYVRLDGSTKVENRQRLVETFNANRKIFLFISSTRAGGIGLNLTGADTVIFYDSDWNPAMDRQAMDRCHRIGQTRDVHIYRLISEHTIEENILRKQLQKRQLDDVVVDQGKFTTDFMSKTDVRDVLVKLADTSDLYQTRVLHDQQPAEEGGVAVTKRPVEGVREAEAFEKALAQVEDAADVIALRSAKTEKAHEQDEFKREFTTSRRAMAAAAAGTPEEASETIVSGGGPAKKSTEETVLLRIDDKTVVELTPLMAYGLRFLEQFFPPDEEQQLAAVVQEDIEAAAEAQQEGDEGEGGEEEEDGSSVASDQVWSSQASSSEEEGGDDENDAMDED